MRELLAPDGSSAWSAIVVGANVESWSAVSTGDGFVLAVESDPGMAAAPPTTSRSIQLFRLGLDGALSSGGSIPGLDPGQVGLAWNGSEVRLWYQAREVDPDSGLPNDGSELQRVAKDGTLVGAPVVVETIEESGPMLLFTAGADTVLLRSDYGIQYLVRLGASGMNAWPEVPTVQVGAGGNGYLRLGYGLARWRCRCRVGRRAMPCRSNGFVFRHRRQCTTGRTRNPMQRRAYRARYSSYVPP